VLRVVEDDMFDDYVAEYTKMIGMEPSATSPGVVYRMSPGRVEVIPESALADVLPGEVAPALPVWAAQAVTVSDVAAARSLVDRNGIATHQLSNGFFVGAADALGTAVVFLGQ
jgi:hypothetical protein